MLRFAPSLFALFSLVAGCAQGGGGAIDAGNGRMDSAISLMDSGGTDGSTGTDSGSTGDDSGTMGDDSGTMGTDSGFDAGFDAGVDSGPPPDCVTAADCADGLLCNGAERCELGSCTSGTALSCDDGIACTRNECVEGVTASCRYTADDSLCPGSQVCGAAGCMASCAESPCRIVSPQCGCPSGQGCYVSGGARLCTGAGALPAGASCTGLASCTPGNICINVARTGAAANLCSRFCNTDGDCAGGLCFYTLNDGAGGSVPGVTICTTPCDPIRQAGCPTGTGCSILTEAAGAMRSFTDCIAPFGGGTQGASCTGQQDCRTGFGCFGTGTGTCLAWCDRPGTIGTAGGCRSGEACFGFTTPLRIGGIEYGVCDTFP